MPFIVGSFVILFLYLCSASVVTYALFPIQIFIFGEIDSQASFLYLPHGVRVLSVILMGWRALPALLLAHLMTGYYFNDIPNDQLIFLLSWSSVLSVYLAYHCCFRHAELYGLRFNQIVLKNILVLSVAASLLNAVSNILIYQIFKTNMNYNIDHVASYFIGDVLGALIIYILISQFRKLFVLKSL